MKYSLYTLAITCLLILSSCEQKPMQVVISTSYGDMVVELYDNTPQHRDNFVKLIKEDFYDGLLFHRVMKGFMNQGGDPTSKGSPAGQPLGSGGPGYTIPNEINSTNIHVRGALSAARQGDAVNPNKESSGSQFYIVTGSPVDANTLAGVEQRNGIKYTEDQINQYKTDGGAPFLDMEYTVFGQLVEGFDVLDAIAEQPVDRRNRPVQDIEMKIKIK